MAKYPIIIQPTEEFMAMLKKEQDPQWTVKDLVFLRWGKNCFSAKWQHGQRNSRWSGFDMNLGGKEKTLSDIEARVIQALKVDGTL